MSNILFIGNGQWGSNTGFELVISIVAIIIVGIWAITSGNMGTHEDTGNPVKSLNTSDGKRNRSKRAYNKRKLQEIVVAYEDKYGTIIEINAFDFCEKKYWEKYDNYYFQEGDEQKVLNYYKKYLNTWE